MQCIAPLNAYHGKNGQIVFSANDAYLDLPVTFRCGKCMPCRVTTTSEWAVRNTHEAKTHEEAFFGTFTYSDQNLPYQETLVQDELSKLIRRIRKQGYKIRYYGCAEYGDTTKRPHYHALIYGWRPEDAKLLFEKDKIKNYTSEILDKIWGLGHTQFSDVTFASAAYTAGYTRKKIYGDLAETHYQKIDPDTGEITDLVPEYSRQSTSPGIGEKLFHQFAHDWYSKDQLIVQGKPMPLPRYYDKLCKKFYPDLWSQVCLLRAKKNHRPIYQFKDDQGKTIQHGYYPHDASKYPCRDRHITSYTGSAKQLMIGQTIRDLRSASKLRDVQ